MSYSATTQPAQRATVAPAAEAGPTRFEELEAYRGVAAVAIVVFHAYQHSRDAASQYVYQGIPPLHQALVNLDGGVAWFFVLSAFLIFLPFARAAVDQRPAESARGFLIRRAMRILPLYYLAILVVWAARYSGGPEQWTDLAEHLTFTHIFDSRYIFWTIGPAWSLGVEVLFYLFIAAFGPLVYALCGRLATRAARAWFLTAIVVALGAASLAYKGWAWYIARLPDQDWAVYFGPLAKLDNFALGMGLAVLLVVSDRPRLTGAALWLLRLAGLAVLVATFAWRQTATPVFVLFHTLNAVAFALVLAASVLGPRGTGWEQALTRRPLQWLGLISYSLYLWHEPVMIELAKRDILPLFNPLTFPVAALALVGVSLVVAHVSYWAVEYPTAFLRHLFNRQGRLVERYPSRERQP